VPGSWKACVSHGLGVFSRRFTSTGACTSRSKWVPLIWGRILIVAYLLVVWWSLSGAKGGSGCILVRQRLSQSQPSIACQREGAEP